MWGLFNNSNQVPIPLSIFGAVLTFVQYFFLPSWIHRVPEVFLLGADFSVSAAGTGGEWSNESKIENHLINFSFSIFNIQTVQPFEYVQSGCFLNNRRITWAPRVRAAKGGLEACYPRKFWNLDAVKRYSCVLRGPFISKMFAKLTVIIMPIFICLFLHTSTRFCVIFQAVYLRFQGMGGGGTAIYGLYRYVPLWTVWFSSSLLWDRVYKSESLG